MLSPLVMTADIITHPDTEEIKNWSWDKESKEKANGQASSIRQYENLVSFNRQSSKNIVYTHERDCCKTSVM